MTKAPGSLQDLRRRIYVKAKAESSWRFWGLYGHVCKTENWQAPDCEQAQRRPLHEHLGQLREEA